MFHKIQTNIIIIITNIITITIDYHFVSIWWENLSTGSYHFQEIIVGIPLISILGKSQNFAMKLRPELVPLKVSPTHLCLIYHRYGQFLCFFGNTNERNYEIYDKAMLTIIRALEKYRQYFEGNPEIWSDHQNRTSKPYRSWLGDRQMVSVPYTISLVLSQEKQCLLQTLCPGGRSLRGGRIW